MSNSTSKLPDVGTTIFAVMSKMAADHNAINLSQGFPDFPISEKLIELVHDGMKKGFNQYAPMPGLPSLRESIAIKVEATTGRATSPSEVLVTAGATEALYAIFTAITKPGDEIILFDPAYDCYDPSIRLNGGIPVHLELEQPNFSIDWNKVKAAITSQTKAILINSPHNPSGAVLLPEDIEKLYQIVKGTNIQVISDEVYEHIIFDGTEHASVLKHPELKKNAIAIYSFGKTFHATGWKVGYIIAPEPMVTEFQKMHQFITFSVSTPVQYGLAEFLKDASNYSGLEFLYSKKRDLFVDLLAKSRFTPIPCKGTYFQLLSYDGVSDKGDFSFAEELTQKHGVASVPISVFYQNKRDDKLLRFCFAKNDDTLKQAAEILCKI